MKQVKFLPALAAVLFLAATLSGCSLWGTKPFQDLRESDIASASVKLTPPGVTVNIGPEKIGELAELLRDTVTYQKDGSYTEIAGQSVLFTIRKTDGTQVTVNAYNPFLIVDGTGYRTKYEPCAALSSFANALPEE